MNFPKERTISNIIDSELCVLVYTQRTIDDLETFETIIIS